jgi:hypothetical protein
MMRETMEGTDGMAPDDTSREPGPPGASGAMLPDFAMALRGYDRLQVDDYLERQQRWAAEVELRLADAEQRAEAGEAAARTLRARVAELEAKEREDAEGPPRSIQALGDRVAHILQTAWDAGEEVREEVVSSARAEAAEIERRAAERDAESSTAIERARAQASEIAAAGEQARDEAEAEAARVKAAEIVSNAEATAERVRNDATAAAERTIEAAERHRDELEEVIAGLVQRRDAAMAELDRVRAALEQVVAAPGLAPAIPPPPPPSAPEPRVR